MRLASSETFAVREDMRQAFMSNLPLPSETEPQLYKTLRQTLQNPGGLIRSQLAFAISRAYRLPEERAQALAISLEYFHTASLLFDDLPSMDDATERRGSVCVHRTFGEPAAILAALALINRAYALLWRAVRVAEPHAQTSALAYVERFLGLEGVLNGQSLDLHHRKGTGKVSSEAVALSKTVPLIRIALVLPALVGGARPADIRALERLAIFWGLGYQILDDLKDLFQSADASGKTSARDALLDRPNLALAIGPKHAMLRLHRLMRLSDIVLDRLMIRLPALSFLKEIRLRFNEEIAAVQSVSSFSTL